MADVTQELEDIANKLRIHAVKSTQASKSGHPTSCSSIAEIIAVLFFHTMRIKLSNPRDPCSDRFVLSKGHAAPILYAAWAEAGLFPVSELMNLRKTDSDLEGHPTPRLNFIDVGTGSLGQGLSIACGMAYMGKYIDKASYRVYCLIGDGESAEGSIWEALHFASFYKLDNLCVIIDVNRMGQSEETSIGHNVDLYKKRFEAFDFKVLVIDGHNVSEVSMAFCVAATTKDQPTILVAKTFKGKNFPEIEDQDNWHGKPLGDKADKVIEHLESLIRIPGPVKIKPQKPYRNDTPSVNITNIKLSSPPAYDPAEKVMTRTAYGTALVKLAESNPRVIALDGDMKNSTFSEKLKKADPNKFIECYIAEQNLTGVAIGIACRDRAVAFVSTFAAFLTRAYDQIRMGAISQTNVNFCGSHCGVSIGEDGPSQMGMEDIAMFRSIPGSTVFYPSDAVSCERAVELAANAKGITFIRTNRPATPIIYPNDQIFEIGKAQIIKSSGDDKVLVIAAGVTLNETLTAYEELSGKGILIRVLDPFTLKPIDKEGIIKNAKDVGGKVLSVEDHYPEGGMGEAVLSAVSEETGISVKIIAVRQVPHSGPPNELLDFYGISAKHIVKAVEDLVK